MILLHNRTGSVNQHVQYTCSNTHTHTHTHTHTSRLQLLSASGYKNDLALPVVPIAVIQRQFVVLAALS